MPEHTPAETAALEAAATLLAADPDYRVIRRLVTANDFGVAPAGAVSVGIVVDTETTGRQHDVDQIVEIGLVRFEFEAQTAEVLRVTETYSALEDPGRPIPPEVTAIHGITDAMVAGQRIDDARVAAIVAGASVVIAHNAAFDRPFLEARLPVFASLPWGCSHAQIPWETEGFHGSKLEYLAWSSGFFYDAHRSEIDCRALLELLRRPLPDSKRLALRVLLDAVAEPALRLWATGSPFDSKDALRARGYRWDADRRCWHRLLPKSAAREESEWLKSVVYGGRPAQIDVEVLDATVRFSHRSGPRKPRVI
jgi:DNA polymerase-3 subunit epsilon